VRREPRQPVRPHPGLALDQDRRIVTASADTARLVGRPACDLIGDDPRTVLGAAHTVEPNVGELGASEVDLIVHRSGNRTIVEVERLRTIAVMTDHDRALDTWIDDLLTAVPGTLDDDLRIVALRLTGAPS
jgi:hypothetical protein